MAGTVTTNGVSSSYQPAPASCDAVERMERAGVIVIGKTNTPAYAAYSDTSSTVGGVTRNPWNQGLSSGGSSGGSAVAVASGMSVLALGTDLGGSVRGPAAWSGLFGIRPTAGRICNYPHGWVDDSISVIGAMARDIRDLSLWLPLAQSIQPARSRPSSSGPFRISYSEDLNGRIALADDVRTVFQECVQSLGKAGHTVNRESPLVDSAIKAIRPLRAFRALATYNDEDLHVIEENNIHLFNFVCWAKTLSGDELGLGGKLRTEAWLENKHFFDNADIFIMPTSQLSGIEAGQLQPEKIGDRNIDDPLEVWFSTYIISILGWPSVTIPCGWSSEGRPIGIQIIGPLGSDLDILSIGERLCTELGWRFGRPGSAQGPRFPA